MQLPSRNGCLLWPLILLILGMCHGQHSNAFDEIHDDSEKDAWLAGVFTPQPLKAAPWQAEVPNLPTPSGGIQLPGVGELHGLRGYRTIRNRPIDAYLGVRYAQVSSGLGRFQQARPIPYQAHINATQQSTNCAQFPELQRLQEAEARGENVDDCLTLDIYTPAGARELPVLVFVHGEMLFDGGSEEAQPDYVLEHDVVLVSINYRLAPFGFLSALSDQLPGNVALSDLHLALEWLQRNLRYFGGSSNQVTLIGQAGGATLAHALSLSPKTQHLFQQLILQSGSALNPYLIDERPLETLATFAELAHCPNATPNPSLLYECIRRLRTSQLVSIFEQLLLQNEPRGLSFLGGFKLVVGDRLGYLPEHPAALVASNSVNNRTKPMIVGATKDASAFILSRFYDQIQGLQSHNLSDYINVVLRHVAPPQHYKIWHDWAIREIFTPEQARFVNAHSVAQGLLELSNLIIYRAPVIDSIRSSYRKSPTYLYVFDYRGEHHRFGHLMNPLPFGVDASLSDDSVYLFPYPREASNLNPEDKSFSRALVTMWVNFAETGIPNPNSNVWPRVTSEYGPFLRFTNSKISILELDQHFGEGINIPNLYPQYFNTTSAFPATTTTTTTRRPYQYVQRQPQQPYRQPQQPNRQPQQPIIQPHQPGYKLPPAYHNYYAIAQAQRREQLLREQQERILKQREELEREQQQREKLMSEEEERKREQQQREEELQREQLQQAQLKHEQQQREQEQREQAARQLQEQHEQQEREQERQENEMRQLQEREQQQREQQEREQQEREQQRQQQQPQEMPEPNEQQREQQEREQYEREQQERQQAERDQVAREQQERDQQQQEQLEREQQEREQQPHQSEAIDPSDYATYDEYVKHRLEQLQREQQEREQQERSQEERDQAAREQQEREQQRREQLDREQQEREQQLHRSETEDQDTTPTYEENVKQQVEQQQLEQQEREQQEAREQQEREQQRREQLEREQQEREQQPHRSETEEQGVTPTYEEYVKQQLEQQQREQQEREQQLRSQEERDQEAREQQREQQERDQQERAQEPYRSESEGPQDPSAYPSYEDYVKAYEQWVQEQNSLYIAENNVSSEQEPPEEAAPINDPQAQPNYGSQQYANDQNNPHRIKLMRRHQRTKSLKM